MEQTQHTVAFLCGQVACLGRLCWCSLTFVTDSRDLSCGGDGCPPHPPLVPCAQLVFFPPLTCIPPTRAPPAQSRMPARSPSAGWPLPSTHRRQLRETAPGHSTDPLEPSRSGADARFLVWQLQLLGTFSSRVSKALIQCISQGPETSHDSDFL